MVVLSIQRFEGGGSLHGAERALRRSSVDRPPSFPAVGGQRPAVRIRVLGPLHVESAAGPLEVAGCRLRALLCALAIDPERAHSADALVDVLWPRSAPSGALLTVRSHVARLRRLLGAECIVTGPSGYRLGCTVDVDAVHLVATVSAVRSGVELDRAVAWSVLGMWRGTPFTDLPDWLPALAAAQSLTEDYLALFEHWIDHEIDAGRAGQLIGQLELATADHPLRESLWVRLARARLLSGDRAGALRACSRARRELAESVGLTPGVELEAVERAIFEPLQLDGA